jgi:hypothetical protein
MTFLTRLLVSLGLAHAATAAIMPTALRCEYHANPAAIGTTTPRFSWKIQPTDAQARHVIQSPYELEVTREDGSPLWASGKVESPATGQIEYAGEPLKSRDRAAPGFDRVRISPRPTGTLTHVSAAMETRHGRLACAWKLDGGRFTATLAIPPNTTADVILPGSGTITENGQTLTGRPGVISSEGNRAVLGSGTYQLEITQ